MKEINRKEVKALQKVAERILANVNHLVKDRDDEYLEAIIETCRFVLSEKNYIHPSLVRIASIIKSTHKPGCDCGACKFLNPEVKR